MSLRDWLGIEDDDDEEGMWWDEDDDETSADAGDGAYEGIAGDGQGRAAWGLDPEDLDDEDPDGLGEGDGGDWAGASRDQRVQQESDDVNGHGLSTVSDEAADVDQDATETAIYGSPDDEAAPVGAWVQTEDGGWVLETVALRDDETDEDHPAYQAGYEAGLAAAGGADERAPDDDQGEGDEGAMASVADDADQGDEPEDDQDDDDEENDDENASGIGDLDICMDCGAQLEAGATANYCPNCSS